MTNVIQLWLELIGTPERANKLLQSWQGDPAVVLLGQRGAEAAYANPRYRPALDSWDCGLTTRRDLMIWAKHIVTEAIGSAKQPSQTAPWLSHNAVRVVPATLE